MLRHRDPPRWGDRRRPALLVRGLHLDAPLMIGIGLLCLISLVVVYSASGQDGGLIAQQLLRLLMAFMLMALIAQIPPHHLEFWAPWFYGLSLGLLFAVMLFGDEGKGAQRWLDIGGFRFQPSEMMKLALPMMVAWYFADHQLPPNKRGIAITLLLIAVPAALIARQPDLGTAMLIVAGGLSVLLLAGLRIRHIMFFVMTGAALAPLVWFNLHDYQKSRILNFLDPERDPLGTGYHIIQSKIAIGSGGLYGKGWMNGSQAQLDFLPEQSTDFIFAVLSEEFGLIGVLLLLAIYLFVISRGLYIATQAQDTFARLLAGGLILSFFVYMCINIGMVTGLLPVVGVPLPLISYGGTSMVTLMSAFGVLMSIQTHRRLVST
ncbi:MAG: rod shape-determining protein RodA [Gammaproteobacteria bacterium]|nr:rod shape-determining protein RodA [Gammaproteobacteria bacterium]